MANNLLANFALPTLETIGQVSIVMDSTFVAACSSVITEELAASIASSGGMDGMKYRAWAVKCVAEGMMSRMGNRLAGRSQNTMQAKLAVILTLIGAQLGATDNKDTYLKTMGPVMEGRTETEDALSIAFNIIREDFRTFVNQKSASAKAFPSLKYTSCLPDFTLLGVMIVVTKTMSYEDLCAKLVLPFMQWPEILRKKFIGNFALDSAFQKEHMVWEKFLWDNVIGTTNNKENKEFKKGFVAKNYATTVNDKFLVLTPEGTLIVPSANGYSKAQFCMCIAYLYQRIKATQSATYTLATGNQFTTTGEITATAKSGSARLLSITHASIRTAVTEAVATPMLAITATAPPADFASVAEVASLVATVDANRYTF